MYQNQYNPSTSASTVTSSSYSTTQQYHYQYPYQYQNYYGYQPPPPPPPTSQLTQPAQPPPLPPPTDPKDTQVDNSGRPREPPPPGTTDECDLQQENDVASSSGQQRSSGEYAEADRSSTPSTIVPYSDTTTVTQSDSNTAYNSRWGGGGGGGSRWDTTNTQSHWSQQGTWNQHGQYGTPQSWHSSWQQPNWSQTQNETNWSQSTSQQNWQQQQQQQYTTWTPDKQQQQQQYTTWTPDKQQQQYTTWTPDKQQQQYTAWTPDKQEQTQQQGSQSPQQEGWQQQQSSSQIPQNWQQISTNQSWTPQQGWSPHQWSAGQWTSWGHWSSQNWLSQPPSVEAWAGQKTNQQQQQQKKYENSNSGSNYSYQQQTVYSKQDPPPSDPKKQVAATIQSELNPPRSPGTPPLNDLLPPGGQANDDSNDRVVPPVEGENRKRYSSDYHEIPEVKRQHYASDMGSGVVGQGVGAGPGHGNVGRGRGSIGRGRGNVGRTSRWDNPGKKQKRQPEHSFSSNQQSPPPPPVHPLNQRTPPAPAQKLSPKTTSPTPSSRIQDKWPPGLKEYVNRAFSACRNDEEKDEVHKYLDVDLNRMFKEGRQWDVNWDQYPSPLELRKAKAPSRWDTPSPSTEFRTPPPKNSLQVKMDSDDEQEEVIMNPGIGRGRGRKRKRQKKKGKNKFFIDNQPSPGFIMTPEDQQKMNQRSNRFGRDNIGLTKMKKLSIDDLLKANSMADEDGLTWRDKTLEGTSESLEKQYLRLTSAPDRNTVRPVRVLKLSLKHVMDKWRSEKDYHYTCEQLKSIRQDLTIQTVRNDFTVLVYETHARVALSNGDRGEFNQCQAQLKSLYAEGVPGHQAEFIAYRILYLMLTQNTADMCAVLRELTFEQKHTSCVKHALSMFSAWSLGNYHQFFKLYKNAPNFSGAVVDMFLERERKAALKTISKAYRPNIKVTFLTEELGFDRTEDCVAFLNSVEAVLDSSNTVVDCKLTQPKL